MRRRILFRDEEIAREIEWRIADERLKEGDKLPSERDLAEEFGVQRDTVRSALDTLIKRGVLISRARRGHYVAPDRIQINLSNFRAIRREVESIGDDYRANMLSFEKISIDKDTAARTGLPEGTLCFKTMRIRYGSEKPLSLERSYIVAENVPGLTREDLEQKTLTSILRQRYGIIPVGSDQRISQVYPDSMEAELLRVSMDEPLIRFEGLIHDRKDRLIEFFDNVVLPDRIEFHIRDFA